VPHASPSSSAGPTRAISVGIIEPQRLFAPFLTQILSEAGFSVVASLESLSLDEIGRYEPTVVFADVDFIDIDPVLAIRQLRTVAPDATICAYTGCHDEGWAATCARAGANCVISKSAAPDEIVAGLMRALRVGAFVDSRYDAEELADEDDGIDDDE
jgi:DNA-binding NarL/FixJ family response regulator